VFQQVDNAPDEIGEDGACTSFGRYDLVVGEGLFEVRERHEIWSCHRVKLHPYIPMRTKDKPFHAERPDLKKAVGRIQVVTIGKELPDQVTGNAYGTKRISSTMKQAIHKQSFSAFRHTPAAITYL
jgi:hypothetical protein